MKTLIIGAGDHAKVVYQILSKSTYIDGFIDICNNPELWGKSFRNTPILGGTDVLDHLIKSESVQGIVAFGANDVRRNIFEKYREKVHMINVVHETAVIDPTAKIGIGVFIGPRVIINHNVQIHDNCIINSGAIVEHDCIIGNNANIGPGANIAGNVTIGANALIGIGATIIDAITIGDNSIIGAGATVIKDVPNNVVAVGVPARIIKTIN